MRDKRLSVRILAGLMTAAAAALCISVLLASISGVYALHYLIVEPAVIQKQNDMEIERVYKLKQIESGTYKAAE